MGTLKNVRFKFKETGHFAAERLLTDQEIKFLQSNLSSHALLAPYTGYLAELSSEANKIDSEGFSEAYVEIIGEHDLDKILDKKAISREIVIIYQEIGQMFKSGTIDNLSAPQLEEIRYRLQITNELILKLFPNGGGR